MARTAGSVVVAAISAASATQLTREASLLQTMSGELAGEQNTPVTRVVNLLKEMSLTLDKETEEDEGLYKQLACWCSNGDWDKSNAIEKSEAKIEELEATIESLTAKSAELTTTIKEAEEDVAANKAALAEATSLREKQLQEFHGGELDSVQALENLKAAIVVLGKHHSANGGTAPNELDSTVAGGAVFKSERDSWSFLQQGAKRFAWASSRPERNLDEFMRHNELDDMPVDTAVDVPAPRTSKFLQETSNSETATASSLSAEDDAVVKKALKMASAFMQSHGGQAYYPAYTAQSGEIMGVLKQLKEEMGGDLAEAQKLEAERASAFADLRAAKSTQIAEGEKMAEQKEDELAETNNALAEAKEDLDQEKKVLADDQKFLKNLKETCANAEKNFNERKNARIEEAKAIAETIGILTQDQARDAMSGTFSFVQIKAESRSRKVAAEALRRAGRSLHLPQLGLLATSVELDAFTKVKKAIDDMIGMLNTQQADEVKKNDWCKAELHENEMTTEKTDDEKTDLEARIAELQETIKALEDSIADAKAQIAQLQVNLQRASLDREAENMDFQKTVADQTVTISVLNVALDRMAKFYDLLQQRSAAHAQQTPPVPQMEYKPSKASGGVMQLLEKLIYDSKELRAESQKSESASQAAYEQNVADTNDSIQALTDEIVSKTQAKVDAQKDKLEAESDHDDTVKELQGLAEYNTKLHNDCDYVLKNFDTRQKKRGEEIEALQQAKQILSGASLS